MPANTVTVLERAMYSIPEASRSLGLRPAKTRSWLDGYERAGVSYPPVIRPEHTGSEVVTWGEYVELWYLREYRRAGVSLQKLRPVIAELRDRYQTPYPLAVAKPYIDPAERELILALQEDNDLPAAIALVLRTGQTTMIAEPASRFYRKVESASSNLTADVSDGSSPVLRIRPLGEASPVEIDPELRYGRPQVDGISTEVLWEYHSAGESFEELAEVYEIDEWRVRAAVAYHEHELALAS